MVNIIGSRFMLRCTRANCGILKHSFVKQEGLLDVHKLIGKLPKPKVDLLFQVISTQEKLGANNQPLPGQEPYNQIDAISPKHDICYRDNNNKQEKLKCDKDMLNSLSKTKTKGVREPFDKKLVQAAIRTKYKLKLGAKNGNRRRGKLI